MIIWLASYPRSGNTLLRVTLNTQHGIQSCDINGAPNIGKLEGMSNVVGHIGVPMPVEDMRADSKTHFVKTHSPPCDDQPAIYLIRDGRDATVSWAHYLLKFHRDQVTPRFLGWRYDEQALFRRTLKRVVAGKERYGLWAEHVRRWTTRPAGTTFVLRFEDLAEDPARHALEALKAVGYDVPESSGRAVPGFEELHAQWPQFFRKGKKGGWQQEMSPDIHESFWKHHGSVMDAWRYPRQPQTLVQEGSAA